MSTYAKWKAHELRHSKRFVDGKRVIRQDFATEDIDGGSPTEGWDCKCEKRWRGLVALFRAKQAQYDEQLAGRNFHLCLKDPAVKGYDLVVVRADRYAELVNLELRVFRDGVNWRSA